MSQVTPSVHVLTLPYSLFLTEFLSHLFWCLSDLKLRTAIQHSCRTTVLNIILFSYSFYSWPPLSQPIQQQVIKIDFGTQIQILLLGQIKQRLLFFIIKDIPETSTIVVIFLSCGWVLNTTAHYIKRNTSVRKFSLHSNIFQCLMLVHSSVKHLILIPSKSPCVVWNWKIVRGFLLKKCSQRCWHWTYCRFHSTE